MYLIGFAGCGKLTIARAIQMRYPCILVDNHFINNVIFSLIDPDGKTRLPDDVWVQVSRVQAAVFDTIRTLSKPGRSFIFTNELLEGEADDHAHFLEIAALARYRNMRLLPVRLTINPAELARRVVSAGRAEQLKETDAQAALIKAQQREVFRPPDANLLEIDVTTTTAEDVAEQILGRLHEIRLRGA
jgi:broad-specificity NMP kinase